MSKIDTIIVVGNGFDVWQDLRSSYMQFQKYYLTHREEIMKRLHIKMHKYYDQDKNEYTVSDVELVYGNPFEITELCDDFWSFFEVNLDKINTEQLNLFFSDTKSGLKEMERSVKNANRILREAFCNWVQSITIEDTDSGYAFGDNCIVINFNYTDTLQKHHFTDELHEFHIHGEAADKKSIIFGHSSHPQLPDPFLYQLGGRFRGLYLVDKLLYETDKHTENNTMIMCMFMAMHGIFCEEIKDIYVLGHSMSPADISYFSFLAHSTKASNEEEDDILSEEMDELEEWNMRTQYTINSVGYGMQDEDIDPNLIDAMRRQQAHEQDKLNATLEKDFIRTTKRYFKRGKTEEVVEKPIRTEDAKWHISCHSEKDKIWSIKLMETLAVTNYQLYDTIDECIEEFKV